MQTLNELQMECRTLMRRYPNRINDIMDIYEMARDEVNSGGSEVHEVELALGELNEMIKDSFGEPV